MAGTPRVYTETLGSGVLNPGFPGANFLTIGPPPGQHRWVIRDCVLSVDGTSDGDLFALEIVNFVTGASPTLLSQNFVGGETAAQLYFHWVGRQVLGLGDTLVLAYYSPTPFGQEASLAVTGYDFLLP